MPMNSVLLRPGVELEATPALNEAGISQSQLIRTKNGITQVYGGWETFGISAIPSTVRDLHPWQDIRGSDFIGCGATNNLVAVTAASYHDITPQTITTNPVPNFSISSGSKQVTVVDADANPSVYNTVFFQTQVSIGDLIFQGAYPITSFLSTGSYTFDSSVAASTTIASSGTVPGFNSSNGSAFITVTMRNHTAQAILGLQESFRVPTTVGGVSIDGPYSVSSILDSTTFLISATNQATSTSSATMNSSLARLIYYFGLGPPQPGTGYGAGGYGDGSYGIGSSGTSPPTGTPITAVDWTQDNWGEVLLSCPKDGPIYEWSPDIGTLNSIVIAQAPLFNGGIFVSMPQQILVAWKSVQTLDNQTQDNLVVRWSNAEDFTDWTTRTDNFAGSFHIPTGSVIIGGLQAPNYGVIWTDIDVWIMQFVGATVAFNFTRAGSGCGLIGSHAAGVIAGDVYWCGKSNFFKLSGSGVEVVPCTVWDFIFQNLSTANAYKIRCAPNSAFNEIAWFFPSTSGTGENDSYVKLNIIDKTWDYGTLARTAWADVSVAGNPIGTDTTGVLNQHETGNVISGASNPSFRSGWWSIADGNQLAFVDFVMPDFMWGTFGNTATSVNLTFFSADYPGDTPRSYGPYTVTQATEYITPRIRGRLMSVHVQSATNTGFWRLGRIRYRYAPAGKR